MLAHWKDITTWLSIISLAGYVWAAASDFQEVKSRTTYLEHTIADIKVDNRDNFTYLRTRVDEINSKLGRR